MAELPTLSGPRVAPASGQPPDRLVIFLHGVGVDGNDLIVLAPLFQEVLPTAAFVAPDAPFRFDMEPVGRQWFSLRNIRPKARLAGARKAAPILDAFIDSEMARHRLGDERIALVGFSQGAMMALHVGLRRARAVAGIVSYSGLVVGEDLLKDEMRSSPPVLLTHGSADQILPFACLAHAEANLKALGLSVEAYPRLGLPHGIDEVCIRQGRRFLVEAFESSAPRGQWAVPRIG